MRIGNVILGLRASDRMKTYFKNSQNECQVFGAVELELALKNTFSSTQGNCAFVIPTGDKATANTYDSGLVQTLAENFSVITAVRNDTDTADYGGVLAYNYQHDIRAAIFKAMLGWYIQDENNDRNVGEVQYVGSNIVGINGAYLWWQYDFKFDYEIKQMGEDGEDGYIDNSNLNNFDKIYADYILKPSVKFENLEYDNLPLTQTQRDAAQSIGLTVSPNAGGFWFGFNNGFNVLQR